MLVEKVGLALRCTKRAEGMMRWENRWEVLRKDMMTRVVESEAKLKEDGEGDEVFFGFVSVSSRRM